MSTILVGTTLASHKLDGTENDWLTHADAMREDATSLGHELSFFAAFEECSSGDGAWLPIRDIEQWRYTINANEDVLSNGNRLFRIATGRNLITEYGMRLGAEWILFLDSDLTPAPDSISRLLEVDWPIVGGHCPNYCLGGPQIPTWGQAFHIGNRGVSSIVVQRWHNGWPREHQASDEFNFRVQVHWNPAGYMLVHRSLFRVLRWRDDSANGDCNDVCYDLDARRRGFPTLVRHDVIGEHAH